MIKRWLSFWFEYVCFIILVLLGLFLYIEPHFKKNFESLIQKQFQLSTKAKSFFISPTGKASGTNLLLKGTIKNKSIKASIDHFKIIPKEFIYKVLLKKKENFDWAKDLNYDFHLKKITIQLNDSSKSLYIKEIFAEVDKNTIRLSLNDIMLHYDDHIAFLDSVKIEQETNSTNISIGRIDGVFNNLAIKLDLAFVKFNNIIKNIDLKNLFELRIENLRLPDKQFTLRAVRLIKSNEHSWDILSSGQYKNEDFHFNPNLFFKDTEDWSLSGKLNHSYLPHAINYLLKKSKSKEQQFELKLHDKFKNTLSSTITYKEHLIITTWQLHLEQLKIPQLKGPSLSGTIQGGISTLDNLKKIQLKLNAKNLTGSLYQFNQTNLSLDGELTGNTLTINQCDISEQKDSWNASIQNLKGNIKKETIESADILFNNFPLGKYSPKVAANLSGKISILKNTLKADISSPEMFPNKDPLQKMVDLKVLISANDNSVKFTQSFKQSGYENEILLKLKIKNFLTKLTKKKKGVLTQLKIKSPIFILNQSKPVEIIANIFGAKATSFHLDDENKRLRHLKGSAYIPFLKPQDLNIQVTHGYLEMGNFQTIANSPLKGNIEITTGHWKKGWGLRNLYAKFKGTNLELQPQSVLPQTKVSYAEGYMNNSTIFIEKLLASPQDGGSLTLSGNYHLPKNNLFLSLQGNAINYKSDSFTMNYSTKDLHLHGHTQNISVEGNIILNQFQYSEPFQLISNNESGQDSIRIQLPESMSTSHKINLNFHSREDLKLSNNVGNLNFKIKKLNISGPLLNPLWNGEIYSSSSEKNKLTVPIQLIDIKFNIKQAKLKFNNEREWNPKLTLFATTFVKDTQVNLNFDQKLNQFRSGTFSLSSNPPFKREEIISILSTGEVPKKNIFDEETQSDSEINIPSINIWSLKEDQKINKRLSLSGKLNSESELFEVNVQYKLSNYLELELIQDTAQDSQIGLRMNKSSKTFKQLFQSNTVIKHSDKEKKKIIRWHLSGASKLTSPGFKRTLLKKLKKLNNLLDIDDLKNFKSLIKQKIDLQLYQSGYLFANYSIKAIQVLHKKISRHQGKKVKYSKSYEIFIELNLGERFEVQNVILSGWPQDIKQPEHKWTHGKNLRTPLYNKYNLDQYCKVLINTLRNYGFPGASIQKLELLHIQNKNKNIQTNILKFNQSIRRKVKIKKLNVSISVSTGPVHNVAQYNFVGNNFFTNQKLKTVLNLKENEIYNESLIQQYKSKVLEFYKKQKFFDSNISIMVYKSKYYNRMSIHYQIYEGKRWNIRKVLFKGLKSINESYLKNKIPNLEGKPACPHQIEDVINTLSQYRSFSTVSESWVDISENTKDLILTFEEVNPYHFSFRLGYESEEGAKTSFIISHLNLFEKPNSLSFETEHSKEERINKLSYLQQRFFNEYDSQIILGEQKENISDNEIENFKRLFKLSLIDTSRKTHRMRYNLIFQDDENNTGQNQSVRFQIEKGYNHELQGPQKYFNSKYILSLNNYISEKQRFIFFGDYKITYGIKTGKSLLVPWIRYGYFYKFNRSFNIPLGDRFFLGGSQSLRGFANDEIGSNNNNGGESLISSGVQLYYPLNSWLDGSFFYENGNVFEDSYKISLEDIFESIGIAFMLRSPLGPIQLFFAKPISHQSGRLGLQLGAVF